MRLCRHLVVTATVAILPLFVTFAGGPTVVSTALVSAAHAQGAAAKPDYAAAKRHYAAAEKAASAKEWDQAAKEYGVAYEITRDPVLFFKLGNAYQLSGDCTRAVEYFERYLAEAKPSEEYQADTKSRISTCHSSMATNAKNGSGTQGSGDADPDAAATGNRPLEPSLTGQSDASDASDASNASEVTGTGDELASPQLSGDAQPSFMDEEISWQQTAGWTSVGVSVAFLTASAVLGLSASSREEDIENLLSFRDADGRPANFDSSVSDRYETLADEGETLSTMSMVALGGAGVSAAAAIVFFVLDGPPEDEAEGLGSLTPRIEISPTGKSSVGVGWNF